MSCNRRPNPSAATVDAAIEAGSLAPQTPSVPSASALPSAPDAPDAKCTRAGCLRAAKNLGEFTKSTLLALVDPQVSIDNGYAVWAVEYVTSDRTSLATVTLPSEVAPPAQGYSIVANNHGTTGLDDPCTITGTPYGAGLAGLFGAHGMVGVASDYPGIGTPGVHPYLVSESEGKASLDALRAARALAHWQGVRTSERFAVVGISQGGHATLAAAAMHAQYAPELDIRAFAAGAPASVVEEQWRSELSFDGPQVVWNTMLVYAWTSYYGYIGPSPWAPGVLPVVQTAMAARCAFPMNGADMIASATGIERAKLFDSVFLRAFQSGQWGPYAQFGEWFTANRIRPYVQTAPLKIYQGAADVVVREGGTNAVVEALRRGGVTVAYEVVPSATHTDLVFGVLARPEHRTREALAWIRARLASP